MTTRPCPTFRAVGLTLLGACCLATGARPARAQTAKAPAATPATKAMKAAPAPAPAPPTPTPTPTPTPVPPRPRVALLELAIQDPSPALAMQLQDGFVLALVTGGVDVVDPGDVSRRLAGEPALLKCESSPCLKQLGQRLGVRQALRVRVEMSGNNYRMTARLFSTEGAAPAALPIATKTRPCDICTVSEARAVMLRLADDVRPLLEEKALPLPPPPPPPPPKPSAVWPIVTVVAGLAAVAMGSYFVYQAPNEGKRTPAFGGALAGVGAAVTGVGLYVTFGRVEF